MGPSVRMVQASVVAVGLLFTITATAGDVGNTPQKPTQNATGPHAVATPSAVAELPDYPGAKRVKVEHETKPGRGAKNRVTFLTSDAFKSVRDFYVQAIAANRWQVTGTQEEPGEVTWYLSKGKSTAKVEIDTGDQGTLEIELSRTDP